MKSAYRFTVALSVCLLVLVPVAVFAQTTGTVDGTVTDQSNAPLPGVTVELTSPNLQGTRTAVTSADGRFRFPAVPPGPYTVTAELAGLGKVEKRATVSLDALATVNLSLQLSTTAEVTVAGEAPVVDVSSTTQGTNYSAKVIDKLPLDRNYASVVFSQPGVQADFGETQGRSLAISIYGSTSSENLFLIDGVNTTNVIKGFQGKDINTEFIQEVEVKTGGYQAEYGRNTGGVVNVITKSGGNEFHGGVFGYYNDSGMEAQYVNGEASEFATPDFSEEGATQDFNSFYSKNVRQEWGLDLGGFVLKDKIWFFGAYDRVQVNQNLETADVDNGVTFGHEFPVSYVQNKYSGKLTLNLFQGTSIVGSVFSDSQQQNGLLFPRIPTELNPISYAGRRDTGGPDYGARLNQLFGSLGIFTFQYAQHRDRYATKPEGQDLPEVVDYTGGHDDFGNRTGLSPVASGGFGLVNAGFDNNESFRALYAGSFTMYVQNHEIKLGGDFQDDSTSGVGYLTGGQRLRIRPCLQDGTSFCDLSVAPIYDNGLPGEQHYVGPVWYQHDVRADGTADDFTVIPGTPLDAASKRYSAFIQDLWRIIPTLTLNFGVRWDTEDFFGFSPDPEIGEFKAFSLTDQWAPRVGIVWDWAGDGTSKLYASAGRFYFSLPTFLTFAVFTGFFAVSSHNYDPASVNQAPGPVCVADTPGCVPRRQLFSGGSADSEPVDEGTKASYQDEATFGIEKALDPTLSIGLKGTYRTLGRTVEDRCDLDSRVAPSTCAIFNPGGSGPAASGEYPTCNGSANPTDPGAGTCAPTGYAVGDAKRIFRGIELVARKQFTNELWTQLSFLYSSLKGNYSGAISEATGQTFPGVNADYDYYQFTFNDYGKLELDRPVQARIDAVYNAPFGLSAGTGFYVRSGLPVSRLGYYNDRYVASLYLDTRGTNTRTIFGNERTPTDYELSLSLAYNANIGSVTITPQVYLFNALNRQTVIRYYNAWNVNGSFAAVGDPASPFYGQAGLAPGEGTCPASATQVCTDNLDWMKAFQWTNPRLLRVALKVTF